MTLRLSVRAEARERYLDMKEGKGVAHVDASTPPQQEPPTPDPSPPLASLAGGGEEHTLTARIRALYEGSSVPVREIAAIAGVTERTLYKYVEKHGWKRRYQVKPRGLAAAASNRGRGWRHAEGFVPVKGSGGRFIRRADKDKPFATGLKALDPEGRARSLAACDEAEPLARAAQDGAERDARVRDLSAALAGLNRARDALKRYRAERRADADYRKALADAQRDPSVKAPKRPPRRFADNAIGERALELAERVALAQVETVLTRIEGATSS